MCDELIREHALIQTGSSTYKAAISHSASSVHKWQPAGHKVHFFTSFFLAVENEQPRGGATYRPQADATLTRLKTKTNKLK